MASKVIMGTTLLLPSIVILVFLKGTCLLFTSIFIIAVQAFQDIIRTENLSDINHYREFIIAELQHTDIVFMNFQKEKKAEIPPSLSFILQFQCSVCLGSNGHLHQRFPQYISAEPLFYHYRSSLYYHQLSVPVADHPVP